jgi:hypothetical protein
MPYSKIRSYNALLFSLLSAKATNRYCDIFHQQDDNYDLSCQRYQIFIKNVRNYQISYFSRVYFKRPTDEGTEFSLV